MMTFEKPDHSGSPAAKRKESGNRTVLTALEHLYPGDSLRIGGREYLMKEEVSAGKNFTAQGASGGSKGEVIMRLRARHLLDTLSESYVEKQPALEAEAAVFLKPGEPLKIKVTSGEATVTASGAVVEKAQKVPLSEETVRKQAGKTGDTLFAFRRIDVRLEGACFCPVSEINRVRREALEQLEEKLLSEFRRNAPAGEHGAEAAAEGRGKGQDPEAALEEAAEKRTGFKSVHPKVTASVLSEEQLQAVLASDLAGGVYVDASMFVYPASEKPEALISRIHQAGKKAYLALPYIYREETGKTLEHFLPEGKMKAFDGILVRSADEMGMLREWNVEGEIIADAGVYTWNREAAEEVRRLGATWDTIPYELTARELSGRDLSSSELVVYGRTPLMVTAQCLRKNTSGCTHQPSVMTLVDRKGIGFPVRSECAFCQNIIYNSVPTELLTAEKEVSMLKPASVRYSFTTESREETEAILKGQLPGQITRGHIRKGVE